MNRSDDISAQDLLAFSPQRRRHQLYPKRTAQCPSLARFSQRSHGAWSRQERAHVSECPYCQHRTAKQWLMTPPTPLAIAAYRAGKSPDDEAMGIYLSWPEAEPARRLLGRSLYVQALAELIRGAQAIKQSGAEVQAGLALTPLFLGLDQMMAGAGSRGAMLTEESPGDPTRGIQDLADHTLVDPAFFEAGSDATARISTRDHSVTVEVQLLAADSLKIAVISPLIENSGRRVLVELLPEDGQPVQIELRLTEQKILDQADAELLVTVPDCRQFLRNASLLVAWIS